MVLVQYWRSCFPDLILVHDCLGSLCKVVAKRLTLHMMINDGLHPVILLVDVRVICDQVGTLRRQSLFNDIMRRIDLVFSLLVKLFLSFALRCLRNIRVVTL